MLPDKKKCVWFICSVLFAFTVQAVEATSSYEIQFIKGDISQKTQAVLDSGKQGDISLGIKAIDFSLAEHDALGDDPELITLLQAAVQTIGVNSGKDQPAGLSEKLTQVFKTFKSDNLRVAVIDRIALFPSEGSVSLINSFLSESAVQKVPVNSVILKAISTLGKIGNNSSFSLLFAIDLDSIWPDYEKQIENSLGVLAGRCEKEILAVYATSTVAKKLKIVQIIAKNENIPENIKGDVAQNALAESITYTGNVTSEQLELQLLSLNTVADSNWTRAASLVTAFFPVAKSEYQAGLLTADQFSQVILYTAKVGSPDSSQVLSSYLDSLNKDMEKGTVPSKQVVLAVITALGGLGDKTAFDYLLYVTYLEYPEDVISAARDALAKLKW